MEKVQFFNTQDKRRIFRSGKEKATRRFYKQMEKFYEKNDFLARRGFHIKGIDPEKSYRPSAMNLQLRDIGKFIQAHCYDCGIPASQCSRRHYGIRFVREKPVIFNTDTDIGDIGDEDDDTDEENDERE